MSSYDCDALIIGAGIYGLYAACKLGEKKKRVLVVDCEPEPFRRASYVNQARLHRGYHYPRSLHTAIKCAGYFHRFAKDYESTIVSNYRKIYAVSEKFGMCSADNFEKFCADAKIPCRPVRPESYFNYGTVDACYETEEYAIDMLRLRDVLLKKIHDIPNITMIFNDAVLVAEEICENWFCTLKSGKQIKTPFALNASYASLNAVSNIFIPKHEGYINSQEKHKQNNINRISQNMKFELAEMVLCTVPPALIGLGLTIMDGPFFSVMPFDANGIFSVSAVRYTPHEYSTGDLPKFSCQKNAKFCRPEMLGNCSLCPDRPPSSWPHMKQLIKKYLRPELMPVFKESILTVKALMQFSATSDSRPVVVEETKKSPRFISVLGGKINTIYELDEFLL